MGLEGVSPELQITELNESNHRLTLNFFFPPHTTQQLNTTVVWNIKSQQARLVKLIPDDTWGGAGLLGVTIRLDNYAGAEDRLVRVLSVQPKSPAAVAGLVPEKDFLLGTTHQTLESTNQLAAVLQEYQDHVVELYVYNTDSDIVRVVALMPTLSWGGGGLLGAEVGTGYLHRLPASARETEGQSVERKVRYVRSVPCSSGSSGGGGGNDNNISDNKSSRGKSRTVLELEPQLEMEPSDHEDEDEGAEEVKLPATATQSASSGGGNKAADEAQRLKHSNEASSGSNGNGRIAKDASQTQTPQETTQQAGNEEESNVPAASATTDTKNDETAEPAQSSKPTAAPRPANNDAGYVFSKPPPRVYAPPAATTSTPAAAKSSFLPPPPLMHYDTPPPPTDI